MNTPDDARDGETTADWVDAPSAPAVDDGEATAVVPRMPQHSAPPPPMPPPQPGQWDPRWNAPPMPGYSPGSYPPVAPQRSKGPRWVLLGGGAFALVVIAVAATIFATRGSDSPTTAARSSTSAAPAPTTSVSASSVADFISPTALRGLLPSITEINQLGGNATTTPTPVVAAPFEGALVSPYSCGGAVNPGIDTAYGGSGFTGFAGQILNDEPQHFSAMQSLASFLSTAEAETFVDRQFMNWQQCVNVDITQTVGSSSPQYPKVLSSASTSGINTVAISVPVDSGTRECQRAMSASKNVVVDVRVCAPSADNRGWTLARDIGDKINAQH